MIDPAAWARRVLDPTTAQLQPLTVVFRNGTDTAAITTKSLVGITPVPLVQGLTIDLERERVLPDGLNTVKTHLRHVYAKTAVGGRAELVRLVLGLASGR